MEWPRDGHTRMRALSTIGPHLCECEGCPGPKLVAKLGAAGELAKACRAVMGASIVCPEDLSSEVEQCREALLAWDSARSEKEE